MGNKCQGKAYIVYCAALQPQSNSKMWLQIEKLHTSHECIIQLVEEPKITWREKVHFLDFKVNQGHDILYHDD